MASTQKIWNPLRAGDIVDVVAPASSCSDVELARALDYLRSKNLVPRLRRPLFRRLKYLSHTDEQRFKDLQRALLAKDSAAVWCIRGGYGSMRLVPALMSLRRPTQSKLFVGLSDITALHLFLNQEWGWPTLFAPILTRMGGSHASARERAEVEGVVFGKQTEIVYKNLRAVNSAAQKRCRISSSLVGGNLTLVQTSLGTRLQPRLTGKLLFLEDVGERGYRLDRALVHMAQSGLFVGCKGIVLGDFVGGDEPDGTNHVLWTLHQFFAGQRIPVWKGLKAGHGDYQRPLPFGTSAQLVSQGGKGELVCQTGGAG